jgi:hypothetical protein
VDPVSKSHVPRSTWIISALILALTGLAIPAVRHLREVPPPPPPALTLTLGAPPGAELGSGDEPLDAAISPDQRQIVFVATRGGTTMLWRRALDSKGAEALAGTEGARLPAWSTTGDALFFFADTRLRRIALTDGGITDIGEAPAPSGVTSLPDGSLLFAPRAMGGIQRLHDGTISDATKLMPGDRAHVYPISTGTGNNFVYTAIGENGRRTVRLVRDGVDRDLGATSGHGQIAGGHLLVLRDDALVAQPIDESTGALIGRSTRVVTGVGVTSSGRGLFSASPRLLLSAASSPRARELTWFDLTGTRTGVMGEPGDLWQVRLSPDDQHAAVTMVAPLLRTLDITIVPAAPGPPNQPLTLALAADSDPVWSPDGRRVAFRSLQTGRPTIFTKRALDKDATEQPLVDGDLTPTDWRDSSITVYATGATSGHDILAIDEARQSRATVTKSGFNDSDGRWSPDGSWLAYVSDESGRPDIYASRRESNRVRVSFGGGTRPRWSRDGRALFFLRGSTIMRTERIDAGFAPAVGVLDAEGIRDFDLAHRRDGLLALVPVPSAASATVSAIVDWRSAIPK